MASVSAMKSRMVTGGDVRSPGLCRRTRSPSLAPSVASRGTREEPHHAPSRWPRPRCAATRLVRARLHRDGRRIVPRVVRQDTRAVHRVDRRGRAALDARARQGLGHGRVLDAAGLVARARRSRGRQGQAERTHGRDPAPHRPQPACRVRHDAARRAPGRRRLRRAAGRRRHPHGQHLRRLPRPPRRAVAARDGRQADRPPAALVLRGDQRRHRRRHAGARPARTSRTARPRST